MLLLASFNLVIERLLISGRHGARLRRASSSLQVSISLSSGFSFQDSKGFRPVQDIYRFNLVIERLLISGSG